MIGKRFGAVAAALLLLPAVSGCERDEGAIEKAGRELDEVVDALAHPNEGPLERAGRKADEALEKVREKLD